MRQLELVIMKAFGFAVICRRTWQSFFSLTPGRHAIANVIYGGYSTLSNTERRQETNQEKRGRVFICVSGLFQVKSQYFQLNR